MSPQSPSSPPILPPIVPILPPKPTFQQAWSQYRPPTVTAAFSPPTLPITPKRQRNKHFVNHKPTVQQVPQPTANATAINTVSLPDNVINMPPPILDAERILVTEHGWRPIRAGETPTPHAALAAAQIGLWDRQPQPNFNHQWGYFGFEPGSNQHSGNTSTHEIMTVVPQVQTATVQPIAGVVGCGGWRGYLALTTRGADQPGSPGCMLGSSDARCPGAFSPLSGQNETGGSQCSHHHHLAQNQHVPQQEQQEVGGIFHEHPLAQLSSQPGIHLPSSLPQNGDWQNFPSALTPNQVDTPRVSVPDPDNKAESQDSTPPPELPQWGVVPSDPPQAPTTIYCNLPLAPPPSPPQIVTAAPPALPGFPCPLTLLSCEAEPSPPRDEGKQKDQPSISAEVRACARLIAQQRIPFCEDGGCHETVEQRPIGSLSTSHGTCNVRGRYRRAGFSGRAEWIRALTTEANRIANRDSERVAAEGAAGAKTEAANGKKKKKKGGNRGGGRGGRGAAAGATG